MMKPILEPAARQIAEATSKPPFLYDLGPQGARKVLDDIQAAPVPKLNVDEKWITVPARVGDVQVRIVKPLDPALPNSGVLAIFDRNLNSNTVLGLDFLGSYTSVDHAGRPDFFNQVSVDANLSSGLYDEAFSQGIIQIHYIPSGKQTAGVFSQGTAIIKFHLQIYTPQVGFILANSSINP